MANQSVRGKLKQRCQLGSLSVFLVSLAIVATLGTICAVLGLYINIVPMIPFIHAPYTQLVILLDNLKLTSPYLLQPQYTYYDFFFCDSKPLSPIEPFVRTPLTVELDAKRPCYSFTILPEVVYVPTIIVPFNYNSSLVTVRSQEVPLLVDVVFKSVSFTDYVFNITARTSLMTLFPAPLKGADWNIAQLNYTMDSVAGDTIHLGDAETSYWDSFSVYNFDRRTCPENRVCQVSLCLNPAGKRRLAQDNSTVTLLLNLKVHLFDLTGCRPLYGSPSIELNLKAGNTVVTPHNNVLLPDNIDIQFKSGKIVGQVSNNTEYYKVSKIWGLSGQAITYFTADRFYYAARVRNSLLGCFFGVILAGVFIFTIVVLCYSKKPVFWKLYLWVRMIEMGIVTSKEAHACSALSK